MKNTIQNLEGAHKKKRYTFEEICLYPFYKSINMVPYPPNFYIPKFDKYKRKGDPREYVK